MRMLDLFCGAGGCAAGYYRAGFLDITGIDLYPQPRYPYKFIQADALQFLADHGKEFDFIHASPPCQGYSKSRHIKGSKGKESPLLVGPLRDLLLAAGRPFVIENVVGAPLHFSLMLCGSMFGLPIRRHRLFESSHLLFAPGPCQHQAGYYNVIAGRVRGYGDFSSKTRTYTDAKGQLRRGEGFYSRAVGCQAFGVDWMTMGEMSQSVPPAYTEWIGRQLINI